MSERKLKHNFVTQFYKQNFWIRTPHPILITSKRNHSTSQSVFRYFHQVRSKALETIVRSYVPGRNVVQFPVSRVYQMLAFEDMAACATYCRMHGMESEQGDGDSTLFMERSSFYHPEEVPALTRPKNLVESKRKVSWSEVKFSESKYLRSQRKRSTSEFS